MKLFKFRIFSWADPNIVQSATYDGLESFWAAGKLFGVLNLLWLDYLVELGILVVALVQRDDCDSLAPGEALRHVGVVRRIPPLLVEGLLASESGTRLVNDKWSPQTL